MRQIFLAQFPGHYSGRLTREAAQPCNRPYPNPAGRTAIDDSMKQVGKAGPSRGEHTKGVHLRRSFTHYPSPFWFVWEKSFGWNTAALSAGGVRGSGPDAAVICRSRCGEFFVTASAVTFPAAYNSGPSAAMLPTCSSSQGAYAELHNGISVSGLKIPFHCELQHARPIQRIRDQQLSEPLLREEIALLV